MVVAETITLLFAGVIRNIVGFIENLVQGTATKFEAGKLVGTVLRTGMIGLGLYYGFSLDVLSAAGLAVAGDFALSAVKTKVNGATKKKAE